TAASGGGGGSSACSVHIDSWTGGFVAYVTVNGPTSGWSIPFSLASGSSITNSWNVTLSGSGSSMTGSNVSYNGNLAAGQSTTWGFQGTGSVPSVPGCTSA
ncbi:MAG: cellulose binding domain-containing protein, partial [Micromonosporaceae bacterium]|nr:cellulose binding domain-containing protein [Micromonosporaceae bacterium]